MMMRLPPGWPNPADTPTWRMSVQPQPLHALWACWGGLRHRWGAVVRCGYGGQDHACWTRECQRCGRREGVGQGPIFHTWFLEGLKVVADR